MTQLLKWTASPPRQELPFPSEITCRFFKTDISVYVGQFSGCSREKMYIGKNSFIAQLHGLS